MQTQDFRFGIEAEFLVASADNYQPLWHQNLTFKNLNEAFEAIDISDLPSLAGLELEAPHRKLMPYVVEGYHLPNQNPEAEDILPKGVEIRTPICHSLDELMLVFTKLYDRLQAELRKQNLVAVSLSHHPLYTNFSGPKNKRRDDWWQWAMRVMTTYGPDLNLSLPDHLCENFDYDDIIAKTNYYAPALAAISVASPFADNSLWTGKSYRMHRRSEVAPAIEVHPEENGRLEFKMFDATNCTSDYVNYFLLCLALTLDDQLKGRCDQATMAQSMQEVAVKGLAAEGCAERLREVLQAAYAVLPQHGFFPGSLASIEYRVQRGWVPADDMITRFKGSGLGEVLRSLSQLQPSPTFS